MATLTRRDALRIVTSAPFAAALVWTPAEARQAHEHVEAAQAQAPKRATPFKPKFFTAHELATVTVLVDLIIPRDERSGSATDAGVPQFMDFMMVDQPQRQIARCAELLALVDRLSVDRFGKRFVTGTGPAAPPGARRDRHTSNRIRAEPYDRVLQQFPRPDRRRILVHEDGRAGSAVQGTRSSRSGRDALTAR